MKLNDELIIAFIRGTLSEDKEAHVEELINENDENFLRYSQLYNSYFEAMDAELDDVPDELIEKANKELGISQIGFSKKIKSTTDHQTSHQPITPQIQFQARKVNPLSINEPRFPFTKLLYAFATISAVFIVFLSINETDDKSKIGNLNSPQWIMRSTDNDSLDFSIQIMDQNIIISQKDFGEKQLMISGVSGTPIYLERIINDTLNIIQLPDTKEDFVISIYQNDEIMFRRKIEIIDDEK